jgi:hypothetical protein
VTDWPTAATDDLQTMHDLIRDNHPGPINAEDPTFNSWLRVGAAALRAQAQAARTQHDYRLVLQTYANGFADGHVDVRFNVPEHWLWPGFLTRIDASADPPRVVLTEQAPGVSIGDVLVGCGTESASELLTRRVLRLRCNPKVPHRMRLVSPWLTVVDAEDADGQAPDCCLWTTTGMHTVKLHWRPIDAAALSRRLSDASGIEVAKLGMQVFRGTWLISLPSFNCRGPDAARMQQLIGSLRARVTELHNARRVVFDLRGNCGGDSQWGEDIITALWGAATTKAVKATFDLTVDWRVSRRNCDALRANAIGMREAGHTNGSAKSDALARRMDQALAAEAPLMSEACAPVATSLRLESPFKNTVYVLTTPHCASACLDFLDLLDRLPETKRVGLPTYADTKYLESAFAPLPSGLAKLVYPMKVYRNRARGADAAYYPEIAWSGGTMTDEAVIEWIDDLP